MSDINSDKYKTVAGKAVEAEIKVKGSRFIGRLYHVADREQAEDIYSTICKQFYDATHNCPAYRIDENDFRYSDDGEPSGTAGRPIFTVLEKYELVQVLLVVTRYFGGTKLGTGGLARAYADCADAVIGQAKIITKTRTDTLDLEFTYDMIHDMNHFIGQFEAVVLQSDYAENVRLTINVPKSRTQQFEQTIKSRFHSHPVLINRKTT